MDGTLYVGNRLFDFTLPFLEYIKEIGGKAMFLTNNSSKNVSDYIIKLKNMGINSQKSDFFTSLDATVCYLNKNHKDKKIYVFGTSSMKNELADKFNITDVYSNDVDCLLMGFDTELKFSKLEDACKLLNNGVDYIATNPDLVCPTEYGSVPDCGSVSEMLYNATLRRPLFIGKPAPEMILFAIKNANMTKEQSIVIGDRLHTDIASGINAKITTALVLSGESQICDIENSTYKPDFVFKNIGELHEKLRF